MDIFPLVSSRLDIKGDVIIELRAGTADTPYTAISHVWAGGLGNTEGNFLPSCQIAQIHRRLQDGTRTSSFRYLLSAVTSRLRQCKRFSPGQRRKIRRSSPQLFYIDTLCVPRTSTKPLPTVPRAPGTVAVEKSVLQKGLQQPEAGRVNAQSRADGQAAGSRILSRETPRSETSGPSSNRTTSYRRKAINALARIYEGAENVLVLDSELEMEHLEQLTDLEVALVVACSPWTTRSWTLQEGALARKVTFQFATDSRKYSDIRIADRLSRPSSSFLMETVWDDLIENAYHPERNPKVADYVVRTFDHFFLEFSSAGASSPTWSLETLDLFQFARAWNALTERSTNKLDDVAAILASLLNLSAGEILSLRPQQRTHALLKRHSILPAAILLVANASAADGLGWTPRLPSMGYSTLKMTDHDGPVVRVTDSGLVLDDTSSREGSSWFVAPGWTAGDLPHYMRMPDGRLLKLETTLHEPLPLSDADTALGLRVLWLTEDRDVTGCYLGRWFSGTRNENTALHVAMGKVFYWRYEDEVDEVQGDQQRPGQDYALLPLSDFLSDGYASSKPIVVDMGECCLSHFLQARSLSDPVKFHTTDIKSWPDLQWSRTAAFPLTRFGDSFFSLYAYTVGVGWALPVLSANLLWSLWLGMAVAGTLDELTEWPRWWGLLWLMNAIMAVRATFAFVEWHFLDSMQARWIQQMYATSFWSSNSPAAGSDLGRLPELASKGMYPRFVILPLLVHVALGTVCAVASTMLFNETEGLHPWTAWRKDGLSSLPGCGLGAIYDEGWLGYVAMLCFALATEFLGRACYFVVYLCSWHKYARRRSTKERRLGRLMLRHEVGRMFFACLLLACLALSIMTAEVGITGLRQRDVTGSARLAALFDATVGLLGASALAHVLLRPLSRPLLARCRQEFRRWNERSGAIQLR